VADIIGIGGRHPSESPAGLLSESVADLVGMRRLGHESPTTTHQYVEADLAMKDRALARLQEPNTKIRRYRAPNSLLEFLRTL
jgi:hypothetical protein